VKRKRQLISHVFVFVSCLFLRRFFVFVLVSANEIDLYSFCAIFVFVNVNYTGFVVVVDNLLWPSERQVSSR